MKPIQKTKIKVWSGPNDKGVLLGWLYRAYYALQFYLSFFNLLFKQLFKKHRKLPGLPKKKTFTAVITGGSRGIGAEVVRQLLQAEMKVIIGCRQVIEGNLLIQKIRESGIRTGEAECRYLDLKSLGSVRRFVKTVLSSDPEINVLINNAGVMTPKYELSVDEVETQFQVNYLANFLLTILLIPALVRGGRNRELSRIINLTSDFQRIGKINPHDTFMRNFYSRYAAYSSSQLMTLASSNYIDSRLRAERFPVASYCVNPGVVNTHLYENMPGYFCLKSFVSMGGSERRRGADRILYAIFSEKLEGQGGTYISNYKDTPPNPIAQDLLVQRDLWLQSCEMTNINKATLHTVVIRNPFALSNVEI